MKTAWAFGLALLMLTAQIVFAQNDPAWEETDRNLQWSLVTGNPNQDGKAKMVDALTRANLNFAEQLRIGFEQTQSHNRRAIEAFSLCLHSDTRRLYNLARSKLGMAPI